jgi:hypothetical protein
MLDSWEESFDEVKTTLLCKPDEVYAFLRLTASAFGHLDVFDPYFFSLGAWRARAELYRLCSDASCYSLCVFSAFQDSPLTGTSAKNIWKQSDIRSNMERELGGHEKLGVTVKAASQQLLREHLHDRAFAFWDPECSEAGRVIACGPGVAALDPRRRSWTTLGVLDHAEAKKLYALADEVCEEVWASDT